MVASTESKLGVANAVPVALGAVEDRPQTLRAMEAKSRMTLEGGEPLVGKGEALEAFEGKRVKPYSERNLPQHNTGDLTRGESPMCADCPLDNTLIPPHSSPTPHMGGHCTAEVSACTHSFVTLKQLYPSCE